MRMESAAVGEAVAEFVDGLGFVQAGQAQVVVRAVHCNVFGDIFLRRLSSAPRNIPCRRFPTHVFCREVRVHAGAVPVALDRFTVEDKVHFIFLAEARHQVACGPGIVRGLGGTFGKSIGLQITNEARLIVRAPYSASEGYIHQLISRKVSWIKAKQDYFKQRQNKVPIRKFVQGEEFLFLGQSYPLVMG